MQMMQQSFLKTKQPLVGKEAIVEYLKDGIDASSRAIRFHLRPMKFLYQMMGIKL